MNTYVIVDLEMCNIPKGTKRGPFHRRTELIQIGAVLLNDSLEIVDRFMTLVKPQLGKVDEFIEHLTGISAAATENAPSTKEALEAFAAWLPDDAVVVSWSDNDQIQIQKEMEGKSIDIPRLAQCLETWVDCQQMFSEKMHSPKVYKLSEALTIADIYYEDGAHDALVDAKNTALLFAKMQNGGEWTLSEYYETKADDNRLTFTPFAALSGLLA